MQPIRVAIFSDPDIVTARQQGRAVVEQAGLRGTDLTLVTTIISEVARLIAENPLPGELTIAIGAEDGRIAVSLGARIHLADRTVGLDLAPWFSIVDAIRIFYGPDETTVRWVQGSRPGGSSDSAFQAA